MSEFSEFHLFAHEFWREMAMALLCGVILGIEREMRGKPAGLRTSMLIVLGTAVFVRAGMLIAAGSNTGDPTRVVGQVATGIGFIGAGVMFNRGHTVKGVTTAATVWVLAAIGATIGAGYFSAAFAVTMTAFFILVGLDFVENWLERFHERFWPKKKDKNREHDPEAQSSAE